MQSVKFLSMETIGVYDVFLAKFNLSYTSVPT